MDCPANGIGQIFIIGMSLLTIISVVAIYIACDYSDRPDEYYDTWCKAKKLFHNHKYHIMGLTTGIILYHAVKYTWIYIANLFNLN